MSDAPDNVHVALLEPLRTDLNPAASTILDLGKALRDAVAAVDGDIEEIESDVDRIVGATEALWRMVDGLTDADAARTLFEGRSEEEAAKTLRHDMRTPIAAIKGYSEMLLEDLEEFGVDSLRPAFSDLLDEANALLARIDKIVSFSASDAGADARAREALLANVRQELLDPVNAIVGYGELIDEEIRSLDLADLASDVERILTEGRNLMSLADQLVSHELGEETDESQEALRRDFRTPLTAIKGYAEMLIEDLDDTGGEGLRPDFTSLLSEVDRLLDQMDGIIDFSRTDVGATTVAVPAGAGLVQVPVDVAAGASLIHGLQGTAAERAGSQETGHILVVDDLPTNRTLLARRLEREGHRVSVAEGGAEALAMIGEDAFDLVLLDLMMPGMSGFEVLSRLKGDARFRELPVIMVSALDEEDSAIQCILAGAEDYLPKPFNPVLLRARIDACIERRRSREREKVYLERLEEEKQKSEDLLLNILPAQIVERLNAGEELIADRFEEVTVLFSDLVGFTEISAQMGPSEVVGDLNRVFSRFDSLVDEYGVEKVKTIGDAYMAGAGLPPPRPDHAEACAELALAMIRAMKDANPTLTIPFRIRIGMDIGPAVGGIIGKHKFVYDVWGTTVNMASRYETSCLPDRIQVSETLAGRLADSFDLESRGALEIRGGGTVTPYFLNRRKGERAG